MNDNTYYLHENMVQNSIKTALVGVGGSGGYMLDSIVKINEVLIQLNHPGLDITVFDADVVSKSNIFRTKFSPLDVGQNKADVLVGRYNQFYGLEMISQPRFFTVEDISDYDLVISCTDSAYFRIELGRFSQDYRHERGIDGDVLWLDMGNSDLEAQFTLSHLLKDHDREGLFLPNVFDLYGEALEESVKNGDDDTPSCSLLTALDSQSLFINPVVANHASSLLYELFKNGKITVHGGEISLENHTMKPLPINTQVWEFMGVN